MCVYVLWEYENHVCVYMCTCVNIGAHMPWNTCVGQEATLEQLALRMDCDQVSVWSMSMAKNLSESSHMQWEFWVCRPIRSLPAFKMFFWSLNLGAPHMTANALHWAMSLSHPGFFAVVGFILQPPAGSQSWRFGRQKNKFFVYTLLFGKCWCRALQLDCKFLGVRRPPFILVFLSTIDTPCTDACALCRLHSHRKTQCIFVFYRMTWGWPQLSLAG